MSGIDAAKAGMGFQLGTERPRCASCCNCKPIGSNPMTGRDSLRCTRGGFLVSPYAVCNHYQAERRATGI